MALSLTLTARVQAGHKLEIVAPELTEGEEVNVLITQTAAATYAPTPPGADDQLLQHLLA